MAEYIDKSALVAEIDKGINGRNDWQVDEYRKGYHDALIMLKKYLSTLEVKEVDLEKETKKWWKEHLHLDPKNQLWMDAHQSIVFAKHFFELGLKTQKGENI